MAQISGTTNFSPSLGDGIIYAFNLIGIRPAQILQEHMQSAQFAANLVLSTWSGDTPDLWKVSLVTVPLVQGQATYPYASNVIVVLDTYISIDNGDGTFTDRLILPISRTEYASYPEKSQQGFPTVIWPDRLLNPTLTLWPVPDGNQTYLKYYCVTQIDDAVSANGTGLDIPSYFMEPFMVTLASRLAMIWAPDKAEVLEAFGEKLYAKALSQNTENANLYVSPMLSSYFSR